MVNFRMSGISGMSGMADSKHVMPQEAIDTYKHWCHSGISYIRLKFFRDGCGKDEAYELAEDLWEKYASDDEKRIRKQEENNNEQYEKALSAIRNLIK